MLSSELKRQVYAQRVREVYREAEIRMIEKVRRRMERGITEEGWAEKKLAEIQRLQYDIQKTLEEMDWDPADLAELTKEAYEVGSNLALEELGIEGERPRIAELDAPLENTRRMGTRTLARAAVNNLEHAQLQVVRKAADHWRRAIVDVSAQVLAGTYTIQEAVQRALNDFADRGLTGFIDKLGRQWSLAGYAEMAVRTTTAHAQIQGYMDRLAANGRDLVIVSDHMGECPLCRPWEGRVLSITGTNPDYPSVAEATAAGLFHPNCGHRTHLYTPGLSMDLPPQGDPEDYENLQRQQECERMVHHWRKRKAAAVTPEEKRKAEKHLAHWRAEKAKVDEKVKASGEKIRKQYDKWLQKPAKVVETEAESPLPGVDGANPEWRRKWEQTVQMSKEIDRLAEKHGMTPDEYEDAVAERLKELVDRSQFFIRTPSDVLEQILADGRFKSQHETSSARGYFNPQLRANFEQEVFGVGKDSPLETRPIYGYVDAPGGLSARGCRMYGDVVVTLKKDRVLERTTIIGSDSLDANKCGEVVHLVPVPAAKPTVHGFLPGELKYQSTFKDPLEFESLQDACSPYCEAQYHGGVTLDDIDYITFTGTSPSPKVKRLLEEKGIKYQCL